MYFKLTFNSKFEQEFITNGNCVLKTPHLVDDNLAPAKCLKPF